MQGGREPVTVIRRMRQRGIVDGDAVRVWNHRGQVLAGAVVTDGIRLVICGIHEGAWLPDSPEPTAGGICKKRRGKRPDKRSSSSGWGTVVGNTALVWFENIPAALPLTAFDPP